MSNKDRNELILRRYVRETLRESQNIDENILSAAGEWLKSAGQSMKSSGPSFWFSNFLRRTFDRTEDEIIDYLRTRFDSDFTDDTRTQIFGDEKTDEAIDNASAGLANLVQTSIKEYEKLGRLEKREKKEIYDFAADTFEKLLKKYGEDSTEMNPLQVLKQVKKAMDAKYASKNKNDVDSE